MSSFKACACLFVFIIFDAYNISWFLWLIGLFIFVLISVHLPQKEKDTPYRNECEIRMQGYGRKHPWTAAFEDALLISTKKMLMIGIKYWLTKIYTYIFVSRAAAFFWLGVNF